MRHQFIQVLKELCHRRSSQHNGIQWWFSEKKRGVARAGDFSEEGTMPFGRDPIVDERDPDAATVEEPPLSPEFFAQLKYG